MLMPKKVKFRKQQKGKRRGKAWRGSTLSFGEYGLKVMECGYITDRQIEASRIAMTRFIKRGGKIWLRLFPDKPITKKPAEVRMGSGKGRAGSLGCGGAAGQDPVRDGRRCAGDGGGGDAAGVEQAAAEDEVCAAAGRREDGSEGGGVEVQLLALSLELPAFSCWDSGRGQRRDEAKS